MLHYNSSPKGLPILKYRHETNHRRGMNSGGSNTIAGAAIKERQASHNSKAAFDKPKLCPHPGPLPSDGRGRMFASLWINPIGCWLLLVLLAASALANPQGMTVTRGSASASQTGSQLNVRGSNGANLNWGSFYLKPGATTAFIQTSRTSVVWNRITDPNLSQVWGTLNANGWVVLMNQNGFYFGPNSVVSVGGLVVTAVPVASDAQGGGAFWQFNGTPPLASIVSYGEIKANAGGSIFLVSDRVENHGIISAPGGTVGLYAGQQVQLSERPDGRGLSANVTLPKGSVDNSGKIIADAGTIALHAEVVNQNGLLQADSV